MSGSCSCSRPTGPRRFRHHIEGIFRLIEEELATNSMYRGKAFDGQEVPQFLDLSGVDASKVVYTAEVLDRLGTDIWALIRYPEQMREMGLPLKRAVLLEGPYGTGKTLAAYLTAQIAQEHGWTFIYGRPGRDELGDLMATARLYQPAVVFFEDVDTVASADGVDDVSRMLDILDGMQSKGTEIICILTTNHIDRLHKGMVRPGRLDAVIHIGALDPPAVERLIRSLVPEQLLTGSVDWPAVGAAMEGFMPAFCKEAIDRAMRWNLARNEGKPSALETIDFVTAADTLRPQLELMGRAGEHGGVESVGAAISRTVRNSIDGTLLVRKGEKPSQPWAELVVSDGAPNERTQDRERLMGVRLSDVDERVHEVGAAANWNESRYVDFWDRVAARRRMVPHRQPPERGLRRDVGVRVPPRRPGRVRVRPPAITANELTRAARRGRWSSRGARTACGTRAR